MLNCRGGNPTVGSNPTSSATFTIYRFILLCFNYLWRNFIDDNSWNSAITFPVLYIIAVSIPGILAYHFQIDGNIKNIISVIFLTMFITPAWVILGAVTSKNKLPYLISLIAGIPGLYFIIYFLLPGSLLIYLVSLWSYLISF